MNNLTQHPLSAAFPAMTPDGLQVLEDSIAVIGVQNAITLFEGQVIDGWHRYLIALRVGVTCPTQELGDVDPRDFVKVQNRARRSLTASRGSYPHSFGRGAGVNTLRMPRVAPEERLHRPPGIGVRQWWSRQ